MLEVVRKRTRNFENGVLADDPALVDPLDYELLEFRVREAAGENGFPQFVK